MNKKIIFAIVGESGSGKSTVAEYIEERYGIRILQSKTDRPKRHENEVGHTFLTKEEFSQLDPNDFIAFTNFGGKRYCCLDSDLDDINSYVVDQRGLAMLDKGKYDVISIRIYCKGSIRLKRITKERAERDKGMFSFFVPESLQFSIFDHCVRTDMTQHESQLQISKIIDTELNKRNIQK